MHMASRNFLLVSKRVYTVASENIVKIGSSMKNKVIDGIQDEKPEKKEVFWMRHPKTGYYMPDTTYGDDATYQEYPWLTDYERAQLNQVVLHTTLPPERCVPGEVKDIASACKLGWDEARKKIEYTYNLIPSQNDTNIYPSDFTGTASALYSALVDDLETTNCFFDDQEIKHGRRKTVEPVIDLLLIGQEARSLSQ
ncbi:senescence-associated gene 21 [Tanacetum coccineum]